jgi:hypothetical protein
MRRLTKRKKIVAIAIGAVVLAGGGVAVAYWTAGGSGVGSAATGTGTGILVNQTSTVTDMHPGDSAQVLSGDFDNSNEGDVQVSNVTVHIASVFNGGVVAAGCDATDYTLTGASMPAVQDVPSGTSVGAWSGATIKFNNKPATNQDGCKGAVVNLAYVAS